ncbi:LpxD N-terminal domain-containing protein [Methylopila sp. M107]|uniref:LpxD N-terminal domain-containing protein n=1 Tax=Methylopila sp. M107 TaxID=1101190 RepID=UPI000371AFDB|nr:LpxD N-terminal domain-containing protein [Methylopila sp. M107]
MTEPRFHQASAPLDLAAILALTGARADVVAARRPLAITGVGALDWAGPADIAFFDGPPAETEAYAALGRTDAGACFVPPHAETRVPPAAVALVTEEPRRAYLAVAAALFPAALKPVAMFGPGVAAGAAVHPEARLEPDVSVDPGAVIGPGAEIGRGAVIGANAVVGPGVRIGRDSALGHGAAVSNALVGDRVVIQQGVAIGDCGYGECGGAASPSLGRVIVQDDAVIGANAAVARGRDRDTIIGEASRVAALARIAPDVVIGRHCLVYADAAVPEGATVGDHSICGLEAGSRHPSPKDSGS